MIRGLIAWKEQPTLKNSFPNFSKERENFFWIKGWDFLQDELANNPIFSFWNQVEVQCIPHKVGFTVRHFSASTCILLTVWLFMYGDRYNDTPSTIMIMGWLKGGGGILFGGQINIGYKYMSIYFKISFRNLLFGFFLLDLNLLIAFLFLIFFLFDINYFDCSFFRSVTLVLDKMANP